MTFLDIPSRIEIIGMIKQEMKRELENYDKFNRIRDDKLLVIEEELRILRHQLEMFLANESDLRLIKCKKEVKK